MKDKLNKKVAVSASRPLIGSTAAVSGYAERATPEQRADAIIQVLYADTPPGLRFELRDTIAAEIREAVEVEREDCAKIAESYECDVRFAKSIKQEIRLRQS